jgi:hypothetical protein
MLLAGACTGVVAGALYAYVSLYNNAFYLTPIATVVLGAAVGFAGARAARFAGLRSPGTAVVCGLCIGALAIYFSWVVYVHLLFAEQGQSVWQVSPAAIWSTLETFVEHGLWDVELDGGADRRTRTAGPTGTTLLLLWAGEAITVCGMAAAIAYTEIASVPYCEDCKRWTVSPHGPARLGVARDAEQLRSHLSADIRALAKLGPPATETFVRDDLDRNAHTRVALHKCSTCNFACLSLDGVRYIKNGEGHAEKRRSIVRNLVLAPDQIAFVEDLCASSGPWPGD